MFIYEFMGGVMEAVGAAEDEESPEEVKDFDPHLHRHVEKPTSYGETMTHMLKGSIGAGILAMPDAFRRFGLIGGAIGLFVIASFAIFCIHMLVCITVVLCRRYISDQYVLCKRVKKGYLSYPRSIKTAVRRGPPFLRGSAIFMGKFTNVILTIWQILLCCVYSIFVATNVKQVCDYYNFVISIRLHILIGFVPLLLLNMVKSLKLLSPMSSISNFVTLIGLILVFYYLMETDLEIKEEMFQPKSLQDIPIFVGTTLFSLEAVGVILALEYNMDDPKKFGGWFGLLNVAMSFILSLYCIVGAFGYMKYGTDIKASITLNLPHYEKKAQAAKILLAIAIALSHPLQNFVAYNQIWLAVSHRYEGPKKRLYDYACRVALVVIPVAMAIAVPNLGPAISLAGALCLSLLAIVFPAIIDICVWYPDQYGVMKIKLIRDIMILFLGVFALVSGVYVSILEMTN